MSIELFVTSVEKAKNKRELNRALKYYLSNYSIKSYAFTYYSHHTKSGRDLIDDWASPDLRAWHKHYLDQAYADVDRTLENSHEMSIPIYWDVEEQLPTARKGREKLIREESIAFGIDKGLSLPVHGPHQDFAILVLHQRRGEDCLDHYKQHQFEWLSAAIFYVHYLRRMLIVEEAVPLDHDLTAREIQCLKLTAHRLSVDVIATRLGISQRTVNFHLQNANRKLGVANKYQAVIRLFE